MPLNVEPLESRLLLAVNVELSGGTLKIESDADGDVIELTGTGDGAVDVFVDNELVESFTGVENITANLGDGDDELSLNGVRIAGDLNVKGGDGADTVDVDFGLGDNVSLGGNVKIKLGDDAGDIVRFEGFTDDASDATGLQINIGGNLTIQGAATVNLIGEEEGGIVEDIVRVAGNLKIKSKLAELDADGESIDIDDLTVEGNTTIRLKDGEDIVEIEHSSFVGKVSIKTGGGNDEIDLDDQPSTFGGKVLFHGGSGANVLFDDPLNVFASPPKIKNFDAPVV